MIRLRSNSLVGYGGNPIIGNGDNVDTAGGVKVDDLLVATHGDSMSRDFAADTSENYAFVVRNLIKTDEALEVRLRWRGVNGISWRFRWTGEPYVETMEGDGPLAIDGWRDAAMPNWLVMFAGTNGITLASHTAARELDDFEIYLNARIAAGWLPATMVVCTMLPRDPSISEAVRTEYNNGLISRAGTFGYKLARLDLDPNIGGPSANLNPTYYYDQVHLNETGHGIAGQIIKDAIFP